MKKQLATLLIESLEQFCQNKRQQIQVSAKRENLYHASLSMWSDNDIVVEADGSGGAHLRIVTGNYPIDYSILSEVHYRSDDEAVFNAERRMLSQQNGNLIDELKNETV